MGRDLVSAEEARKLLEGATPGLGADGIVRNNTPADSALLCAAPRLARTVIALTEERDQLAAELADANDELARCSLATYGHDADSHCLSESIAEVVRERDDARRERDRLRDVLDAEIGTRAPAPWTRNDIDVSREGIAWYRRWEADGSEPGDEDTDQTRVAWVRHDPDLSMVTWAWEIEAPARGVFGKQIATGDGCETALDAIEAADRAAAEVDRG